MIPFWHPSPIRIIEGTLELHFFGMLVAIGIILGMKLAQFRAREQNLDDQVIADLGLWVVLVGFFFAHQVSLFAYFPEKVFGTPCDAVAVCGEGFVCGASGRCDDGSWLEVLKIWSGISSFGGFLGAAIGFVLFFQMRRIIVIPKLIDFPGGKGLPAMMYIDCIAFGFAAAWIFGRLGCFSAHDHIGALTDSFLGVKFPDDWRRDLAHPDFGGPGFTTRWDLGLMEVFWSMAMFAFFWFWARKQKNLRPGWFTAMMMLCYAPYRFWLDSLRAVDIDGADRRYFATGEFIGVTPGQIGAIVVLLLGLAIWFWGGTRRNLPAYVEAQARANDGPQNAAA